jgi:diguanylate cyclase (GGDEF)-like protein/PAS domain S-box-containing protein
MTQLTKYPTMYKKPFTILLVDHNSKDTKRIYDVLINSSEQLFQVECVSRLSSAIDCIKRSDVKLVLLSLMLPDKQGIDVFKKIQALTKQPMILILTEACDERSARQAVELGAYDFFNKSNIEAYWFPRLLRYLIDRNTIDDALFQQKEWAQITLDSIGDAVLTTNLDCKVTYLNRFAELITGWSSNDALGKPVTEILTLINSKNRQSAVNPALHAIKENKTVGLAANSVLIRRDNTEISIADSSAPIHDRQGQVTGAVLVFRDVTESRTLTLKMSHLAQHDCLTGLPNRILLTERIEQAIKLAKRHQNLIGLLFLDLDHFKYINDSLGHKIGDQMLQSVAERLQRTVRNTDTICRQGGDEFVVLLTDLEDPQEAGEIAGKICKALAIPYDIDGHDLHGTSSIGISIYPNDGEDAINLIQRADTAMYHAKTKGRNNYQFFKIEMNTLATNRLLVESKLRRALIQGEFFLHYQPQIDLISGSIIGAEALIRWQDPELGTRYPDEFLKVAEECGLILQIGRWVLKEACHQVQAWLDSGLPAVTVAVNISALEFKHCDFLKGIKNTLKESGLAARYLEIEMTETMLMDDAKASISVLNSLQSIGVKLAMDDFGTGYSSLNYLKRFPISTLKIDQSFVQDITTDSDDATIVGAVIGMGINLNQRVIAEGIETAAQLDFLKAQSCNVGQGFYFSQPLSSEAFTHLLENKMLAN